jgi:protoporphyrinogen oxidase
MPSPSVGRCFVVIGGGPAGLTAAHEVAARGIPVTVLEASSDLGGIARTASYRGFRFDMGGHRFFTRSPLVFRFWQETLGPDFLRRPRLSRIYFGGRFFHYPLRPLETLLRLGPLEGLRIAASWLRFQILPHPQERSFEQWVENRFGRRLFRSFFQTYTEKVWGIPCSELSAEWAAQRIKDLSLRAVLLALFRPPGTSIRSLIEEFHYPRLGPGQMWEAVGRRIEQAGGKVLREQDVVGLRREGNRVVAAVTRDGREFAATDFISSMPLTELVRRLDPPAAPEVLAAASRLRYRDFLTVCLILEREDVFPDSWIYVHEPGVRVGRIQNFRNWSPDMVPGPGRTALGLEYFCNEGDDLWRTPDAELVALARRELAQTGLARAEDVSDGCVVRVPKSYPVYDDGYRGHLLQLRAFVEGLANCQSVGRNGLHRYNNQDHSMLTGLHAVRNALDGEDVDLWSINAEDEYHETLRDEAAVARALALLLQRIDPLALAGALGAAGALALGLLTALAAARGPEVARLVGLLGQFFPGYAVGRAGVGALYGALAGALLGFLTATLSNAAVYTYVHVLQRRALRGFLARLLEYV